MRQKTSRRCSRNLSPASEHMWYAPLTLIWPLQQELLRVFGGLAYGV